MFGKLKDLNETVITWDYIVFQAEMWDWLPKTCYFTQHYIKLSFRFSELTTTNCWTQRIKATRTHAISMMVLAIGTLIPLPIGTLIPVVGTDWYFGSIAQVTRAAVGIAFPYLNRGISTKATSAFALSDIFTVCWSDTSFDVTCRRHAPFLKSTWNLPQRSSLGLQVLSCWIAAQSSQLFPETHS